MLGPEDLSFGVLGPLEILGVDGPVVVSAARIRAVLSLLLLHANQLVSVREIIDAVWPHHPPATVRDQVLTVISTLRRLLGDVRRPADRQILATRAPGYLLRLAPDQLDLTRFEGLLRDADAASAAGRAQAATSCLRAALAIWRGAALADVSAPFAVAAARTLAERRRAAAERLAELELACGRHHNLLPELVRFVEEHPLHEPLRAQLMLALYRCGDVVGALEAYGDARRALVRELGVEPGTQLARLQRAILARDPKLLSPAARPAPEQPELPKPSQLPRRPAALVGRAQLATRIRQALRANPAAVVTLHGPGGAGKSALAISVAHDVAGEYGDGRLYIDLRGGGSAGEQPTRGEVLGRLLRGLGARAAQVPAAPAEAVALYHSLLSGKRILIVLDNAADAAQVAELLPAEPGCAALVTSRAELSTLGRLGLPVGILGGEDSVTLLAQAVGRPRVDAEPDAAEDIARLCAGLPLALHIAGARLASRGDWTLAGFAARLRDERRRLDELRAADLAVRSCFHAGYAALAGGASERAFRMLGLLNLPEFGLDLAAALYDVDTITAEHLLDELVEQRLVETVRTGRYRLHDLLRLYASELSHLHDSESERVAAIGRALDWFLAGCRGVDDLLRPRHREGEDSTSSRWVDPAEALHWFDTEMPCLTAAAAQAASGPPDHARFVPQLLPAFKAVAQKRGYWPEVETVGNLSLSVAQRLGEKRAEAQTLAALATNDWHAGHMDAAGQRLRRALGLWQELSDQEGESRARHNLGWWRLQNGDASGALAEMTAASELIEAHGSPVLRGLVLHNTGEVLLHLGRYQEAADCLRACLAMRRQSRDRLGESITLVALGRAHCLLDQRPEALVVLDEAITACRVVGNREDEWEALLCRSQMHMREERPTSSLADALAARQLACDVGHRYGQAAAARQVARAQAALGDETAAKLEDEAAQVLFASVQRTDPVVDAVLNFGAAQSGSPGSLS